VHPWDMMGEERMRRYWLPWLVGMPAEVSLAICSMIFGGVFERLPRLRTLFAHGGGAFPGTLGRVEHGFAARPDLVAVDNPHPPRGAGPPAVNFADDLDWARAQDANDPLVGFRDEFLFPFPLYFAGHSLGLQPRRAREYVLQELDDWARHGVEGHFSARNPWVSYHELLAASTARLVGALSHEVVVMNTLSVNLHLLMASFSRTSPGKYRI